MSKELIERLRDLDDQPVCIEAADRIEELERTCQDHGEIQTALCKQLDALQAKVAELVAALEKCSIQLTALGFSANHADEALAKVRKPT